MDPLTELEKRVRFLENRPALGLGAPFDLNITRKVIKKTGIADNTSTPIFSITTTNESGNLDGGAFVCNVQALVGHATVPSASSMAVKNWRGSFSRITISTGAAGVNTAVEDIFSGASAANSPAARDIGTITMSVAETSEYLQTVSFTIDLTGSAVYFAELVLMVEIFWRGFLHAPTIAAL